MRLIEISVKRTHKTPALHLTWRKTLKVTEFFLSVETYILDKSPNCTGTLVLSCFRSFCSYLRPQKILISVSTSNSKMQLKYLCISIDLVSFPPPLLGTISYNFKQRFPFKFLNTLFKELSLYITNTNKTFIVYSSSRNMDFLLFHR